MNDGERLFMVNSNPDDNLEDADNDDDDDEYPPRGPKTLKFLTKNVNYQSTANFRNA